MPWNVHIIRCKSIAGFVGYGTLIHFHATILIIGKFSGLTEVWRICSKHRKKDEFESARLPSIAEKDYMISVHEWGQKMEIFQTILYV
jgi:hypothetical protein